MILQNIVGFRCKDDIHPEYMSIYLSSEAAFKAMQATNKESILSSIKVSDFVQHKMPIPPHEEQRKIASHLNQELTKFDTLTAEAQRAIDLLQERRTALISAAVTGQIAVRQPARN